MTTIILADDHSILRQGLRLLLETESGYKLIGEAGDGTTTIRLMEKLKPDILIVDINMPGLSGLEVTRQVTKRFPKTRVIVLSMYTEEHYVIQALQNGALGYVLKESDQSDLIQAIKAVTAGKRYLSPPLSEKEIEIYKKSKSDSDADLYNSLTAREREILYLLAEGYSHKKIADRLFISPRTVEHHQENLFQKLHLPNRNALVRYAIEKGILHKNPQVLDVKKTKYQK